MIVRIRRLVSLSLIAVATVFCAPALAGDRVPLSALDAMTYEASRDGVVTIMCDVPGESFKVVSRGAILDLRDTGLPYDVVLTSRHGIVRDGEVLPCHLIGVGRHDVAIEPVAVSMEDPRALIDLPLDWAILRSSERLPRSVPRLRAAQVTGGESGAMSLVMRSFDTGPCAVMPAPAGVEDERLIYHACRSRPGLSGAPMVAEIKGEPFVVGIHLGHVMMMNEDFQRYGVARRLSDDLLSALGNLVESETDH